MRNHTHASPRRSALAASRVLAGILTLTGVAPALAQQPEDAAEEKPAPRTVFRGFGNLDFRVGDQATAFSLGQVSLFVTSELTDGLSMLAELVFEREEEAASFEVERFQIQYAHSDRLRIAVGRMHTPLGYWNQTFHHGTWFQTTVERPLVYRFEDEGGVLPVHEVGLQVAGRLGLGSQLRLDYSLSTSNGRGPEPAVVQNVADPGGTKSVNVWLGLRPARQPNLMAGGVLRLDKIPAISDRPQSQGRLDERIVGGFAAYRTARTELLAEYLEVRHTESGGRYYETRGVYVQASRAFRRLRPYYRFDRLESDPADPFYSLSPARQAPTLRVHTAGLHLAPTPWLAIKLEANATARQSGDDQLGLVIQAAVTF